MSVPPFTPSDQAANRRIWAEWLRRPDWRMIPDPGGTPLECHTPWDVGYALAAAYWPLHDAVMDTFPNLMDAVDAEDEIMLGCYGLYEGGEFDPDELPDRVRSLFLMAEQAARSAPPCPDRDAEDARNILEGLSGDSSWRLFALSPRADRIVGI